MNPADKIIREIEQDLSTDAQGRTAVKPGNKIEHQIPKPSPLKRATAKAISIFTTMCMSHEKIREGLEKLRIQKTKLNEQIEEREGRLNEVKGRLGEFCIEYGVTVQPKLDSTGKAFYNRPWKAQAIIKRNSGSMAEPIRLWAVDKVGMMALLFPAKPEDKQTLDITGMRKLLEVDDKFSPSVRTKLLTALDHLVKLGEAKELVHRPDVFLDLAAYDKAKMDGLIPADVIEEAEETTSYVKSVGVYKIRDFKTKRCPACSDKLPKKIKAGHKCKECGTEV